MTGTKKNVHGEGNYEASKQYNAATKKFIESGRVDAAARAARPKTPQEAQEMLAAEEAGKNHEVLREPEAMPPARTPPLVPRKRAKNTE